MANKKRASSLKKGFNAFKAQFIKNYHSRMAEFGEKLHKKYSK